MTDDLANPKNVPVTLIDPGDSAGFHSLVHGEMLSTSLAGDAGSQSAEARWALLGSGR